MIKVSVIIPAYNSSKYIQQTIDSVLKQNYSDFELIMVDDGSVDNTAEIIKSYKDERIIYVYQDNNGASVAKNKAIQLSKGKYIAFLDHDDIWMPDKLKKQIRLFENNSDIGMVFCNVNLVNAEGHLIGYKSYNDDHRRNAIKNILLKCFIISPSLVCIKKECFYKVGMYAEELWYSDWELYVRIIKHYKVDFVDEFLVNYRLSNSQLSKNLEKANLFRIKTLNKIWADKDLIKKYSYIRKKVYHKMNFALGRDNLADLRFKNARMFFITALKYNPFNMLVYLYLIKSFLGNKLYFFLKKIKTKLIKKSE